MILKKSKNQENVPIRKESMKAEPEIVEMMKRQTWVLKIPRIKMLEDLAEKVYNMLSNGMITKVWPR